MSPLVRFAESLNTFPDELFLVVLHIQSSYKIWHYAPGIFLDKTLNLGVQK
jgi:hypothetical protein